MSLRDNLPTEFPKGITFRPLYGGGSCEICPSCGFQFGVSDDDGGHTYAQWRATWRKRGLNWSSAGIAPPAGWDARAQLARLPAAKIDGRSPK